MKEVKDKTTKVNKPKEQLSLIERIKKKYPSGYFQRTFANTWAAWDSGSKMKYLLDTNIFIYLIEDNFLRLSKNQLDILQNPQNEFCISEASLFEIAIKIRMLKSNFGHITMDLIESYRTQNILFCWNQSLHTTTIFRMYRR